MQVLNQNTINEKYLTSIKKKILFLGYNSQETSLINFLLEKGMLVHSSTVLPENPKYDLIISYGFRQIIPEKFLKSVNYKIVNLHISYLPYNKGAHPIFWSFYDNSPKGVSIHQVNEKLDCGDILYQEIVNLNELETFRKAYYRLRDKLEKLFKKNFQNIIFEPWMTIPQNVKGTFHRKSDLPKGFLGWDTQIKTEIQRLKQMENK